MLRFNFKTMIKKIDAKNFVSMNKHFNVIKTEYKEKKEGHFDVFLIRLESSANKEIFMEMRVLIFKGFKYIGFKGFKTLEDFIQDLKNNIKQGTHLAYVIKYLNEMWDKNSPLAYIEVEITSKQDIPYLYFTAENKALF